MEFWNSREGRAREVALLPLFSGATYLGGDWKMMEVEDGGNVGGYRSSCAGGKALWISVDIEQICELVLREWMQVS